MRSRLPNVTRVLPRGASQQLDLVRGLAALLVVADHLRSMYFVKQEDGFDQHWEKALHLSLTLGHQSVMVFFVLSGYLVGGQTLRAWMTGCWETRRYAIARMSRLWTVILPAIAIGVAVDRLGIHLFGEHGIYGAAAGKNMQLSVSSTLGAREIVGNAAFVQTVRVETVGSNVPLWSIANEFWYYTIFPCLIAVAVVRSTAWRVVIGLAVVAALLFVGHDIALYGTIFGFGAALSMLPPMDLLARTAIRRLLWAGFPLAMAAGRLAPDGYLADLLVAVPFGVLLLAIVNNRRHEDLRFGTAARQLAAFSFTLYAVHFPLLVFGKAWVEESSSDLWQPTFRNLAAGAGIWLATVSVAALMALLFERRTSRVRAWATRRFDNQRVAAAVVI